MAAAVVASPLLSLAIPGAQVGGGRPCRSVHLVPDPENEAVLEHLVVAAVLVFVQQVPFMVAAV